MQSLDVIFGAVLAFFIIRGFMRGLWSQVLGLAGWLGGLILAFWFSTPLTTILQHRFPSLPPVLAPLIAFLAIFVGVYFFSRLTASWLTQISEKIHLGWLNRLLGGTLGAAKGAIVLSLILWGISLLPMEETTQKLRQSSTLYAPLEAVVPYVFGISTHFELDTSHFKKQFQQYYRQGKRKIQEETLKRLLQRDSDSTTVR